MLGIRYSEQLLHSKDAFLKRVSTSNLYKKCAKEAALEVARNWNPGLTLSQQLDAVLKVADAVYNKSPTMNDSSIGSAIPGIITSNGKGELISLESSLRTIGYVERDKYTTK